MRTALQKWASIDARSLLVFRRALGGLVLLDLIIRATALTAHYTDGGILPRAAFAGTDGSPALWLRSFGITGRHLWSLLFLDGSPAFTGAVFVLAAAAALAMLWGRGGVAVIVCWAAMASIQARNPLVNSGGDTLLRLLLFWCAFLPARPQGRLASVATAGLIVQLASLYAVTAYLKAGSAWLRDGTALAEALRLESFAKPLGLALLKWPDLLPWLTRGAWLVEAVAPLLILAPIATERARGIGVALLAALQVGIFATLDVGLFQAVALVAMIPLLPAAFWDELWPVQIPLKAAGEYRWSHAFQPLAAVAMFAALAWNINVAAPRLGLLARPVRAIAETLRLEQHWAMFSPRPPLTERGVIEMTGPLERDPGIVLAGDGRPAGLPSAAFRSERWRKLYLNLAQERYAPLRPGLGRYLCGACGATRARLAQEAGGVLLF